MPGTGPTSVVGAPRPKVLQPSIPVVEMSLADAPRGTPDGELMRWPCRDAARAPGWPQRWFWDVRGARARHHRQRIHFSRPAQRSLTPGGTGHALVLYPVISAGHAPCAIGSQLSAVSPSRHGRTRAVCKRGCLRVGGGAWRGDASREWAVLLGGRCAPARGGRTYRTLCIHSHMQNTRNTSKSQTVWQRAQSMERPSFRRASTCTPRRTWGPGRLRARY